MKEKPIDVRIEYVLSAKLTYRGIKVEVKTDPGPYEECRIKLLRLVSDMKEAIDYASEDETSTANGQAGI